MKYNLLSLQNCSVVVYIANTKNRLILYGNRVQQSNSGALTILLIVISRDTE